MTSFINTHKQTRMNCLCNCPANQSELVRNKYLVETNLHISLVQANQYECSVNRSSGEALFANGPWNNYSHLSWKDQSHNMVHLHRLILAGPQNSSFGELEEAAGRPCRACLHLDQYLPPKPKRGSAGLEASVVRRRKLSLPMPAAPCSRNSSGPRWHFILPEP